MVKFWIEEYNARKVVRSNLHTLDLTKLTRKEVVALCIQKWEFMAEAVKRDESLRGNLRCGHESTCALCHRFTDHDCRGCPVAQMSGDIMCFLTPYDDYREWGAEPDIIQAEVDFLYRVLEKMED